MLPGLGNNKQDYLPLSKLLEKRGLAVEVAQVSRADWWVSAVHREALSFVEGS